MSFVFCFVLLWWGRGGEEVWSGEEGRWRGLEGGRNEGMIRLTVAGRGNAVWSIMPARVVRRAQVWCMI